MPETDNRAKSPIVAPNSGDGLAIEVKPGRFRMLQQELKAAKARVAALQTETKAAEGEYKDEVRAAFKAWEEWALSQPFVSSWGDYEGAFRGRTGSSRRVVIVTIGEDQDGASALERLLVVRESGGKRSALEIEQCSDAVEFRIGEVVSVGSYARLYESGNDPIRWVSVKPSSITFDRKSGLKPEVMPDFTGIARRDLDLVETADGRLMPGFCPHNDWRPVRS